MDMGNFNRGMTQYMNGINKMNNQTGSVASSLGGKLAGVGQAIANVGLIAGKVAIGGIAIITAAMVGLAAVSTATAISVEDAFAGVIKTTDGLSDEYGNLNQAGEAMKLGFRDLAKETPASVESLMKIGELGGQLGIGSEQLLGFSKTIAGIGVSTNLTQEEAAMSFAKIMNIMQTSQGDVERLGSAVVYLGNNFATTERDITEFGLRIAGAGQIAGLTEADVLGIGAAMSSVGVQAEAGGTAVQKVLLAMNQAVAGGVGGIVDNSEKIETVTTKLQKAQGQLENYTYATGVSTKEMQNLYDEFIAGGGAAEDFGKLLGDSNRRKVWSAMESVEQYREQLELLKSEHGKAVEPEDLTTFARVAGMTAEQFKKAWQEDAGGAFTAFVEGLGAAGDDAFNILGELGLEDQRLIRSFLSLSGAGDTLRKAVEGSNKAWKENNALTIEAQKRYNTTKSQLEIFKNRVRDIAITIGDALLPMLNALLVALTPLIEVIGQGMKLAMENFAIPALQAFTTALETMQAKAIPILNQVMAIINAVMMGRLELAFKSLANLADRFWEWAGRVIEAAGSVMQGVIDAVRNYLRDNWKDIKDYLLEHWAKPFFEWVTKVLENAPEKLAEIVTSIVNWAGTAWGEKIAPTISTWATKFWEWATGADGAIAKTASYLNTLAVNISQSLTTAWTGTIWPSLSLWATSFWRWASDAATNASTALQESRIIETVTTWLNETFWPAVTLVTSTFTAKIFDWLIGAQPSDEQSGGFLGGLDKLLSDFAASEKPAEIGKAMGAGLAGYMIDGITGALAGTEGGGPGDDKYTAIIQAIADRLMGIFGSVAEIISGFTAALATEIVTKIAEALVGEPIPEEAQENTKQSLERLLKLLIWPAGTIAQIAQDFWTRITTDLINSMPQIDPLGWLLGTSTPDLSDFTGTGLGGEGGAGGIGGGIEGEGLGGGEELPTEELWLYAEALQETGVAAQEVNTQLMNMPQNTPAVNEALANIPPEESGLRRESPSPLEQALTEINRIMLEDLPVTILNLVEVVMLPEFALVWASLNNIVLILAQIATQSLPAVLNASNTTTSQMVIGANSVRSAWVGVQNQLEEVKKAFDKVKSAANEAAEACIRAAQECGGFECGSTDTGGVIGAATGMNMVVPPGYLNDSFPIRLNLTSGELLQVTPAADVAAMRHGGQGGGNNLQMSITVLVNDRADEGRLVNLIERTVVDAFQAVS